MRTIFQILDDDELELGDRVLWCLALEVTCSHSEYLMNHLIQGRFSHE